MENKDKSESLKDSILGKINSQELSMRPKYYFTTKVILLAVTSFAVLVITIFILNFISFSIRLNNQDSLLHFGPRGFQAFVYFFPWTLLMLDIVLVLMLLWLVRRFKFGYKLPALYLLAGLFLVSLLIGFAIDKTTGINERFLAKFDDHTLPGVFSGMYGHARRPHNPGEGMCRCVIVSIDNNIITAEDPRYGTTTLKIILPANDARATSSLLKVGDTVLIAGDEEGGVIRAFGVRKIEGVYIGH